MLALQIFYFFHDYLKFHGNIMQTSPATESLRSTFDINIISNFYTKVVEQQNSEEMLRIYLNFLC